MDTHYVHEYDTRYVYIFIQQIKQKGGHTNKKHFYHKTIQNPIPKMTNEIVQSSLKFIVNIIVIFYFERATV